jgi:LacI family transcriptional regulator, gluconate utilization system Gnt-I transcriptional repressor
LLALTKRGVKVRQRRGRAGAAGALTMLDVARHAGVSAQTVSRVLGRPELVAEATRSKVRQAVEALGYIPNEAARNLASSRTRTVAVVIPTLASSAYAAQVQEIVEVLEAERISVVIGNSEYSQAREENLIRSLMERRPLGFVLTGIQHSAGASELLRGSGLPVVETWDLDGAALDAAVGFSNIAVGRDVGRLFLASGKRRIAFVGGADRQDPRASGRYRGLAQATAEAALPKPLRIELKLPMTAQDGVMGLDMVLDKEPLTEAILFSADSIALGALLECNRRGIRVPEQLSICGVGDYELAPLVTPSLTTVRVFAGQMGRTAAELLLARINGDREGPSSVTVEPQLVRRGSA